MPPTFTTTGGARVGWTNATWPLAQLSVTPDKLTISIRLLGTYSFAPDQVSAVEKYVMIPVLGWGVRIHHCNADCPKRVIFWCLGSPNAILEGIRDSGFLPAALSSAFPERHGIAMRWSAILIAVAIWNALFFLSAGHTSGVPLHPGPFILAPLLFAFALSVGTLMSPKLQRIILKPGRSIGEIRPFVRLLAFISGILLVTFSILLASGAFSNAPNERIEPMRRSAFRPMPITGAVDALLLMAHPWRSSMRAERAKPKSCKDDEIIAEGKRRAALGYRPRMIPSFFPSGFARQGRAKPEGKKELGWVGSLPRAATSAALPWASIWLPLRGAGKANQRAGGDGGMVDLFRAGRLWPTAPHHGRSPQL
jgi:hypothetical protein